MAITLCFDCDKPFYVKPPDETNLCPTCQEIADKERQTFIAEEYGIPLHYLGLDKKKDSND